jgi:uncharacterized OB-fold protein
LSIIPEETSLTHPYWRAASSGVVLLQRCGSCGTPWHPPQPRCPACRSSSYDWVESGGVGELYSYTEVHHAAHIAVQDELPYVIALVRLTESPLVICNFLGPAPPSVGLSVWIALGPTPGGMRLPQAYSELPPATADTIGYTEP